jgi:hypothetical protein
MDLHRRIEENGVYPGSYLQDTGDERATPKKNRDEVTYLGGMERKWSSSKPVKEDRV